MTPNPEPSAEENVNTSPSLVTLVTQVVTQGRDLIQAEIELAKIKIQKSTKKFGVGAALVAIGSFFGIYLLFWIFRTIELVFALWVPAWLAALITAGIILLLLIITVAIGAALIKRGSKNSSDIPQGFKTDVDTIKEGLGK